MRRAPSRTRVARQHGVVLAAALVAAVVSLGCDASNEAEQRADVRRLIQQLKQPNPSIRRSALQALTELGPVAKGATPVVEQVLKAASGEERGEAAITLGALDRSGRKSLPGIRQALADEDPAAKELAAIAVGLLGASGTPAYAQLAALAEDANAGVRAAAIYAAAKVRPDEARIRHLYDLLQASEPRGRFMALRALRELGPSAVREVSPIIAALGDANTGTRSEAIRVVGQLGERAQAATPELLKLLRGGAGSDQVMQALVAVDPSGTDVVSALRDCISTCAEAEARGRAAAGLANYADFGDASVSALLTALQDADARVAMSALQSLAVLLPDYSEVRATLVALVQDGQADLSWKATEVLTLYQESATHDIVALQRGPKRSRLQAAYALAKLPPSDEVRQALSAASQDADPDVRAQSRVAHKQL